MTSTGNGRHQSVEREDPMKPDITIQVGGGGVRRTVRGVLRRSSGRCDLSRWRKVRGHLWECGWSLMAFMCGLLLASVYGAVVLLVQQQPLWFCVRATLAVALTAAIGLGLSAGVRANVGVMLPSLCSAHGRSFLLFLFVSALLSGPITNTLENTERAAASLLCGAELAANQTQELMQRAATPLFSALDTLRQVSSNAQAVAGRVHDLLDALSDGVQHVARTLRNVLHFLVDIGDMCNAKLGSPYRKCRAVFTDARADCSDLLGPDFNFLCDIIDAFLPLCQLARAELFCVVPSYIAKQLRKHLAAPTVAAFERLKREFEFNLSASVTFDLDANSSRSLQQVTQDIMEEVSSDLQVFQTLSAPLRYGGIVLLACSYLRAVRYRRRYLQELDFDNIYITSEFEELDRQVISGGGASVLPITRREARTYITPLSLHLSSRERWVVLVGVASVLRHLVMGGLLVALDFLVFWMLDQVQHQVTGDVVAQAPVTVVMQVNGSGLASDIFRDLVRSFNVLQGGNITVISRKCLKPPSEPGVSTCFLLGFLLGLALLVSVSGGLVQRCRRLVCAAYHPERERDPVPPSADPGPEEDRGGGPEEVSSEDPGRRRRRRRKGAEPPAEVTWRNSPVPPAGSVPPVTCLACGEDVRSEEDRVTCDVPQCPGLYCRPCFHSLGNTCVVCVRPLTFQDDGEEVELDNQMTPPAVLDPAHITWSLMKRRIDPGLSLSDASEADATDEGRPGSDESDSSASFHSISNTVTSCYHDDTLSTVVLHRPQSQTLQDLQNHQDLQNLQNLQNHQDLQDLQNHQDLQNLQDLQDHQELS
ncbi:hypothetical protein INR49_006422 [Caranx melampygus]|nr:hypothetical protein INR49_006422 [Caranx melampygus]